MTAKVVFYQLNRKFVHNQENIPETARQVVYYTLAIGHHIGVLDCLASILEIPVDEFNQWLTKIPEGSGRTKLEGIQKWGEVEINGSHVQELRQALTKSLPHLNPNETQWANLLIQTMHQMIEEPALYLMAKKHI